MLATRRSYTGRVRFSLFRRVVHLNDTRAELATAVGMLREMGMMLWLPEAEAALAD
jgi:hypothetical protein